MGITVTASDLNLVRALSPYIGPRGRKMIEALTSLFPDAALQSETMVLEVVPLKEAVTAAAYNAYTLFLILILLLLSDVSGGTAVTAEDGMAEILPVKD